MMHRLIAILKQRCPVCLQGRVFHSWLGMNRKCPVCDVYFERETGYFLNAMFAGYALDILLLVPTALWLYFQQVSVVLFGAVVIAEMGLLWPLIFRYARLLWLHIDQVLDPRTTPSTGSG